MTGPLALLTPAAPEDYGAQEGVFGRQKISNNSAAISIRDIALTVVMNFVPILKKTLFK